MYALVACGSLGIEIPDVLPQIVSLVVNIIKIAVPIILIIMGMLDLGKAVMAQKDDEIKKGQQTFIKRLIAAVIVFFVVAIVQLVFNILASADESNEGIWSCVNCFLSGGDEC